MNLNELRALFSRGFLAPAEVLRTEDPVGRDYVAAHFLRLRVSADVAAETCADGCVHGDGDGNGDGDGYVYGDGDGDDSYGYVFGDGDGNGYGHGHGDGDGYGHGYGDGNGDGDGLGNGNGDAPWRLSAHAPQLNNMDNNMDNNNMDNNTNTLIVAFHVPTKGSYGHIFYVVREEDVRGTIDPISNKQVITMTKGVRVYRFCNVGLDGIAANGESACERAEPFHTGRSHPTEMYKGVYDTSALVWPSLP